MWGVTRWAGLSVILGLLAGCETEDRQAVELDGWTDRSAASRCVAEGCDEELELTWRRSPRGVEVSCLLGQVAGQTRDEVAALSDTSTLSDIYDVERRVLGIADLMQGCQDRRGLFPTIYGPITSMGIDSIEKDVFEDGVWARALVVDFGGRYLENLHLELMGEKPLWAWDRYYQLAWNTDVSPLRVAAMGIVVHLVVDFPDTLEAIDSEDARFDDYMLFGDTLLEASNTAIGDLWRVYHVDAAPLFDGFFFGDWVDAAHGEYTLRSFSFQTVRLKAWNNRWYLRTGWGEWIARTEIGTSFWFLDGLLATLDGTSTI